MGKETRSFSIDDDVDSQLDHRQDLNASAVVNEFLREYLAAGKAPDAALTMRKERLEDQLEDARAEKNRLKSRISRLERELEDVRQQINTRRNQKSQAVLDFAEKVRAGRFPRENIGPDNAAIKNAAGKAGITPDRFVDQLEAELSDGGGRRD